MIRIAGLLSALGGHFSLVVVGCAEVVVAAVLVATMTGRKFRKEKQMDKNLEKRRMRRWNNELRRNQEM